MTEPVTTDKKHVCEVEVRGYELDSFGHVNHAVYVSYFEHARWKALESCGITLAKFAEWKAWPIIAHLHVSYMKPSFMGEALAIETRVIERGRTSFRVAQEITRAGTPVASAKVHVVLVNERGRPTEMPAGFAVLWEPTA